MLKTANGDVIVNPGDWILTDKETKDSWPVRKEIFEKTYEKVGSYISGIDPYDEASENKLKVEEALENLKNKINEVKSWENVDVDQMLNEIRGDYES